MKILFVCYANINRSFMAERVLKGMLKKRNRNDIEVSSAGLQDMKESAADFHAADIVQKAGFDSAVHRSRLLTGEMLDEADMVIVMEKTHLDQILSQYPQHEGKIRLLKSFSPGYNPRLESDIRDCHKMSGYHYRLCFAEISEAIQGLLKCI